MAPMEGGSEKVTGDKVDSGDKLSRTKRIKGRRGVMGRRRTGDSSGDSGDKRREMSTLLLLSVLFHDTMTMLRLRRHQPLHAAAQRVLYGRLPGVAGSQGEGAPTPNGSFQRAPPRG